jgi:hypothetical protein
MFAIFSLRRPDVLPVGKYRPVGAPRQRTSKDAPDDFQGILASSVVLFAGSCHYIHLLTNTASLRIKLVVPLALPNRRKLPSRARAQLRIRIHFPHREMQLM